MNKLHYMYVIQQIACVPILLKNICRSPILTLIFLTSRQQLLAILHYAKTVQNNNAIWLFHDISADP